MKKTTESVAGRAIRKVTNFRESERLRALVHDYIPGGAHTYSKGDDQFPARSPGFIVRGKGAHVWDPDGNRYIDFGMGLRSVLLGHAYEPVLKAVRRELKNGTNFTRPSTIELDFAMLLRDKLPVGDMSKFAKNGSTVTTAAVKLARAFTGRSTVARCRQHSFFSYDDWFISTTGCDAGIPGNVAPLTVQFDYNDVAGLGDLFDAHPDQIACVILEPATADAEPQPGYLEAVRELCTRHGALMIVDEMITGFRWHARGALAYYGDVKPDLVTYGKGIANGFSVSVLTGRRDVMELGGMRHSGERVFLISTTHGAETVSIAAAIATIRLVEELDVPGHLRRIGTTLIELLNGAVQERGLERFIAFEGVPCCAGYVCRDVGGQPSAAFRTLLMQEMIARGILMPSLTLSYSHGPAEIEQTVAALRESLEVYESALDRGIEAYLVGPPVKPVFRRFN